MKVNEFLANFEEEEFPHAPGPWMVFDQFDPPFTRDELRAMRRQDVIQLDERHKRFRLTVVATYHHWFPHKRAA